MVSNFPVVDIQSTDEERHRRAMAQAINGLLEGKLNAAIDIELSTTAETTTVVHPFISATGRIHLDPSNDAAACDLASGTILILSDSIVNGQFTMSHTLFANARTFRVSFLS